MESTRVQNLGELCGGLGGRSAEECRHDTKSASCNCPTPRKRRSIPRRCTGRASVSPVGQFGQKYLVKGILNGPRERAVVESVWIIRTGAAVPTFVTAYPESAS